MDKIRKKAESTKERTKASDQPWTSGAFKSTKQLISSDWQSLKNKLVALQDPNTSRTERDKKLQQYTRDLLNYELHALEPSKGNLSGLVSRLPNDIDDKAGIGSHLGTLEEYIKYSNK